MLVFIMSPFSEIGTFYELRQLTTSEIINNVITAMKSKMNLRCSHMWEHWLLALVLFHWVNRPVAAKQRCEKHKFLGLFVQEIMWPVFTKGPSYFSALKPRSDLLTRYCWFYNLSWLSGYLFQLYLPSLNVIHVSEIYIHCSVSVFR